MRELILCSKNPVKAPKARAKQKETTKLANCKPACLELSVERSGLLPFLPTTKIELRIAERRHIIILSKG